MRQTIQLDLELDYVDYLRYLQIKYNTTIDKIVQILLISIIDIDEFLNINNTVINKKTDINKPEIK
jgi:hypothetical protein